VLLGHGTQLSYSSGNDFVKRNVFNCLLKEKREVAVATLVVCSGADNYGHSPRCLSNVGRVLRSLYITASSGNSVCESFFTVTI